MRLPGWLVDHLGRNLRAPPAVEDCITKIRSIEHLQLIYRTAKYALPPHSQCCVCIHIFNLWCRLKSIRLFVLHVDLSVSYVPCRMGQIQSGESIAKRSSEMTCRVCWQEWEASPRKPESIHRSSSMYKRIRKHSSFYFCRFSTISHSSSLLKIGKGS
jgi:hypothetical protein